MTTKAQLAARLLGRKGGKARAKSVPKADRVKWSTDGGLSAQAKYTPEERSARASAAAKLRWQRWRERRGQKTTNQGERK